MFRRDWVAAPATIVAREVSNGRFEPKVQGVGAVTSEYVVDVQPTNGSPLFAPRSKVP